MRLHLVFVHVVQQGVVGNGGEVIEFVIIDIGAITFGNHLFDIVVHHCVGFAGPRRSQYDGGTERVHHIDPSVIEFAAILEPVGRLTEYSFSISLVSCMKDSFSMLKTSSIRLCR